MTTADLMTRCAAYGWTLCAHGDGYELIGNGAPATFRSAESVAVWLDHQPPPKARRIPYYQDDLITLYHGRCEDVMPTLDAASFDAVITDIPYGTTACAWDQVIPFDVMWPNIKRLTKPRAAVVLFGSQPFTSLLVASNLKDFKYELVWEKTNAVDFPLANIRPRKLHENMSVFSREPHTYNPQMQKGQPYIDKPRKRTNAIHDSVMPNLGITNDGTRFPSSIQKFSNPNNNTVHPTQKPLALMEYLVRTYTNPGDNVLDFTSGAGTTLRACKNLGRRCVGIEMLGEYCAATVARLAPEFETAWIDDDSDLSDLPMFAELETNQ